MKSEIAQRYIVPLILCLTLLAIVCTACGGPAPATAKITPSTPTADHQVKRASGTLSLKSPLVYVALGASDAVGVGTSEPDVQGYVPRIASHLARGSHLVNLGASGLLLHEALSEELPQAIAAKPELITIWLVANDLVAHVSYDDFMHDLNTLLQRLHSSTQ